jgi:hypothetical protein
MNPYKIIWSNMHARGHGFAKYFPVPPRRMARMPACKRTPGLNRKIGKTSPQAQFPDRALVGGHFAIDKRYQSKDMYQF